MKRYIVKAVKDDKDEELLYDAKEKMEVVVKDLSVVKKLLSGVETSIKKTRNVSSYLYDGAQELLSMILDDMKYRDHYAAYDSLTEKDLAKADADIDEDKIKAILDKYGKDNSSKNIQKAKAIAYDRSYDELEDMLKEDTFDDMWFYPSWEDYVNANEFTSLIEEYPDRFRDYFDFDKFGSDAWNRLDFSDLSKRQFDKLGEMSDETRGHWIVNHMYDGNISSVPNFEDYIDLVEYCKDNDVDVYETPYGLYSE